MNILLIVGTQLRHQYFLASILEHFNVIGIIEYERTLVQAPKLNKDFFLKADLKIEKIHLNNLKNKEIEYFWEKVSKINKENLHILKVKNSKELNSKETINWVKKLECDLMLDYGSGILENDILDILPEWKINLHGGISPYYKGSATLLWPFYMQQPELVGMTFHLLTKNIDGGEIIHHSRPEMFENDSVSDIGCRAVIKASEDIVLLLKKFNKIRNFKLYPQKGGKLFLEKDYKPSIIKIVNLLFKNNLISEYLKNKNAIDSKYIFFNQLKEK